jgi:TolB-like protein/Tfp pilus assembly protein PilF
LTIFHELKRRKVFKVAAAYVIVGWLIMQAGEVMGPALRLPEWINSALAFFLILGFPLAMFFAWAYEMTPEGIKKDKDVDQGQPGANAAGGILNRTIVIALVLALAYISVDKLILDPKRDAELLESVQTEAVQAVDITAPDPVAEDITDPVAKVPDSKSIAVLPFINMSSDPEQEYFSDGITEEVLNLLVKTPELKVTSRSSVFSLKGQNLDIPTVAEKLGVAHILEGSVRKAGNRVRITAQLIEAGSDVHMWSETYDRELDDIFAIQDQIAQEVVKALHIQLLGDAPTATSTNVEAYQLYLRGKHFANRHTRESLESSVTAYQEAIALDANFAPPWEGLSTVLRYQAYYGFTDMQEGMEAARQAAMRALEIDDELAVAWTALATIQFNYDWDWARSEASTRTALKYGSQNAYVLRAATWVALSLGEPEQALALAKLGVDLDPLDRSGLTNLGTTYWALGQPEDEERVYRQVIELYPEVVSVKSWLAAALTRQGNPEEGLQYLDFESENQWQQAMSTVVLHSLGRHQEEQLIRQKIIDEKGQYWAFGVALSYSWHGDADKAFEWLGIAFKQKDVFMTQLIFNPWLAPLHDDPRWEKILDKMGLLNYWNKSQARLEEVDS